MNKNFKFLFLLTGLMLLLGLGTSITQAAEITNCQEACKYEYPVYNCVDDDADEADEIEYFDSIDVFEKSYYDSAEKKCYYKRNIKDLTDKAFVFVSQWDEDNPSEGKECESQICFCSKETSCAINDNIVASRGTNKICVEEAGCVTCVGPDNSCNNSDKFCCDYPKKLACGSAGTCYNTEGAKQSPGASCSTPETCITGICENGQCVKGGRGADCSRNSHCNTNYCNEDYNVCYEHYARTLKKVEGDDCYYDLECDSSFCNFDNFDVDGSGKCIGEDIVDTTNTDTTDTDTTDTGTTDTGITRNGFSCSDDDQCISGYCRQGGERGNICVACREEKDSCAEPNSALPCCGGLTCENNTCRAPGYIAPELGSCEYFCEEGGPMPEDQVCICNPLKVDSFEGIIDNVIGFVKTIALVLAPLAIVWGAGMYVTSAGDPTKTENAKKVIQYALVGLLIIMMADGLIAIFNELFRVKEIK